MRRAGTVDTQAITKFNRKIKMITNKRYSNMITKKSFGLACVLLLLLGVGGTAGATVIYDFNATAVAGFGVGPYGSVTLSQTGSDVDVTVDLRADLNFVNTGGPHAVFSFNAVDVVASDITNVLFNGVANTDYSVTQDANNTPFGTFDFLIDCTGSGCTNGSGGQQSDPLTFTVLDAVEADFAYLSEGLFPAYFAADVICNTGSCNGLTGTIGARDGGTVPEPGTLALFGIGLLGFGVARKWRRS